MRTGRSRAFLRQNAAFIIAVEALFILLFLSWATVRALNPDLTGTEKPMEMAFLSAVRGGAQVIWENALGRPVTYGCILISTANARALYAWAEDGVVVEIQP
ncbi:MAG: DUF2298 domain-containing protein [Anaerolineae bacterium]|nr:DUF2298 domain-containing protein [Anaerolineae bacterium]